jgi:hypothetical protein
MRTRPQAQTAGYQHTKPGARRIKRNAWRARSPGRGSRRPVGKRTRRRPRKLPPVWGWRGGHGADRGSMRPGPPQPRDNRSGRPHRRQRRTRRARSHRRRGRRRRLAPPGRVSRAASRRRPRCRREGTGVRWRKSCFACLGAEEVGGAGMSRGRVRPVWRPLDTCKAAKPSPARWRSLTGGGQNMCQSWPEREVVIGRKLVDASAEAGFTVQLSPRATTSGTCVSNSEAISGRLRQIP